MIKISFTGDAMCSKEQRIAIESNRLDYDTIFEPIKHFFNKSDYTIVNLETPVAGKEFGYTDQPASFNTPSNFCKALANIHVNMVTCANNHILDRGVEGMYRSLDRLDELGIKHIGCYRNQSECNQILVEIIGGLKIAFLSFTYGTNSEFNGNLLNDNEKYFVDLLKQQLPFGEASFQTKHNRQILAERYLHPHLMRFYWYFNKIYNRFLPYTGGCDVDTVNEKEITNPDNLPYIERLKEKIKLAKEQADFVFLCLHVGGQYNDEIGLYTKYIYRQIERLDVDAVIGNHPHCVLGVYRKRKSLYTYSLGNFSFTPGGMWYVDSVYAEYTVVLHVYLNEKNKTVENYTYSVLKNVIGSDGVSRVFPVYDLIMKEANPITKNQLLGDLRHVTKRFCGKSVRTAQKEYVIK